MKSDFPQQHLETRFSFRKTEELFPSHTAPYAPLSTPHACNMAMHHVFCASVHYPGESRSNIHAIGQKGGCTQSTAELQVTLLESKTAADKSSSPFSPRPSGDERNGTRVLLTEHRQRRVCEERGCLGLFWTCNGEAAEGWWTRRLHEFSWQMESWAAFWHHRIHSVVFIHDFEDF